MSLISKSLVFISIIIATLTSADSYLPEKGVLPDKESAIKVVEIVLVSVYGEKILNQRPFNAKLEGDLWKISGTFYCTQGQNCKGGVAHVEISKKDARVRSIIHDK